MLRKAQALESALKKSRKTKRRKAFWVHVISKLNRDEACTDFESDYMERLVDKSHRQAEFIASIVCG